MRIVFVLLTTFTGGFMLIDGSRNLLTGTYFGSGLGPWSLLVRAAGFDPQHFGAVFVALGLAWFTALAGLLGRRRWGTPLAIAVGIATLSYLPVGTVFGLIYLGLVLWPAAKLGPA